MATRVVLLVGTRKGCFILESDEARRDWDLRGPFCDGWPIYNAIHDAESGTIYAAAASEWHGAGVWRSSDRGETWELSSEGLGYGEGDDTPKLSKISGLTAAHGRLFAGVETPGIFESRDRGKTWSLLSTLDVTILGSYNVDAMDLETQLRIRAWEEAQRTQGIDVHCAW